MFRPTIRTLLICPSSRAIETYGGRRAASDCIRYAGNSRVLRIHGKPSRFLLRTHATRERRKKMCLVSRCSGLSIPYFLRSADRKTGGGSAEPVRPPDRKIRQKRLIGRALPRLASSQMFRRQEHKSLDSHKGLLRFTNFYHPSPVRCILREFFSPRPAARPLTARWYFIASTWPASSNHSCIIPSTRPLSSEPRKLFIDGADVKRITT